jgi:very-short-patch-repair endonuclease
MTAERREFARLLRKHPTRAEELLWEGLRGSRFHGAKFRRQVPFGRYVVDFYCHAAKLVVELDGKQHEWFSDYDAGRTAVLGRGDVHVLRFQRGSLQPPGS